MKYVEDDECDQTDEKYVMILALGYPAIICLFLMNALVTYLFRA
jgi:hypothetical protein